jgi:hypothetical protein
MFCKACGNKVVDTAVICPQCGSAVRHSSPPYNYRHPAHLVGMGCAWAVYNYVMICFGAYLVGATSFLGLTSHEAGRFVEHWNGIILLCSIALSVYCTMRGTAPGTAARGWWSGSQK